MNDQKVKEKSEELIRAEQFIAECKLDEADQLIKNFEEKGEHTLYDLLLCHLLKCKILYYQGLYENVVKLAEQTYKESLGIGKNLLSVDILLIMSDALTWFGQSESDKLHDTIKQGEELLKALTQELPAEYKQREAYIAWLKGWFYIGKKDADQALKHLELSLSLREEFGDKLEIAYSLAGISSVFTFIKGDLDRALKYSERSMTAAEESGNKWYIGHNQFIMGLAHQQKGELDRCIMLYEQSLTIFNDLNNKYMISWILPELGDAYRKRGNLERALECIEQSMALKRELGNLKNLATSYDNLIQILIDMGDLEQAQQHLHDFKQLNNQLKDKRVNFWYLFNKALILKTSPRAIKRGKAEQILKQILKDENLNYDTSTTILLNLCELLLTELRMTNDIEVLDELKLYITQLLDIAEKSHSYWTLCETSLIQAKLSLLTFDIKKSQRFLTQAHQIAERFDLTQLTVKIANEEEELLKKLDLWEKLKEGDAPMSDRMELARLDEKIVKIIQKRTILSVQVSEEKVAISKEKKICLVCRGEVFGFSYACKCGANYCENCARALTNLENMCWACDVPIDYSKPVKSFDKEKEKVKVEEKVKKK